MDVTSIFLIFATIGLFVIEGRYPTFYKQYEYIFKTTDIIIIGLFTIDFFYRLKTSKSAKQYLFSRMGMIDFIAIFPSIIGLFWGGIFNVSWLRTFRIFRLLRIANFAHKYNSKFGVLANVIPYLLTAVAIKGVVIVFEVEPWWPKFENLNIILGVVGFSVAILLGTKLRVANGRLYSLEDTVCRIIGAMRDMENNAVIKKALYRWSISLEKTLRADPSQKLRLTSELMHETDQLEEKLENAGIGGPNTANFHRDVAFLLHRITAKTPAAYEQFLRIILVLYSIVLIIAVPGLTGLFSSLLIAITLGGLFFLIYDMDDPLDYSKVSLIDVRLDSLSLFNEKRLRYLNECGSSHGT